MQEKFLQTRTDRESTTILQILKHWERTNYNNARGYNGSACRRIVSRFAKGDTSDQIFTVKEILMTS